MVGDQSRSSRQLPMPPWRHLRIPPIRALPNPRAPLRRANPTGPSSTAPLPAEIRRTAIATRLIGRRQVRAPRWSGTVRFFVGALMCSSDVVGDAAQREGAPCEWAGRPAPGALRVFAGHCSAFAAEGAGVTRRSAGSSGCPAAGPKRAGSSAGVGEGDSGLNRASDA